MSRKNVRSGFAIIETLLVIVILGILGFTGWYVWHGKQSADASLANATNSKQAKPVKIIAPTDYASCMKAKGSRQLLTYPEQCASASGKTFTNTSSVSDSNAVKNLPYSAVPVSLQEAIFAQTKSDAPDCIVNGKIVGMDGQPLNQSVMYLNSGFATTQIGCDDGGMYLFVQADSTWKVIKGGQVGYVCDDLKQNKVPVALGIKTCYPDSSYAADAITYTGP